MFSLEVFAHQGIFFVGEIEAFGALVLMLVSKGAMVVWGVGRNTPWCPSVSLRGVWTPR